jgi:hypothetical protein
MKQVLSKDQVNANLKLSRLAGGTCYKIYYNKWTNEPTFYIWFRGEGITVVHGKKVYCHSFKNPPTGTEPVLMRFQSFICTPYVPAKTWRGQPKDNNIDEMLLICGMKGEKKPINDAKATENRLREIAGADYLRIYKMISELEILGSDLETRYHKDYWGYEDKRKKPFMVLVVRHEKGSFSIPIENVAGNRGNDEEIQNIFFNALNLPVTSKLKTA